MLQLQSIIFVVLTTTIILCDAYKILVVFPLPGKSHSILGYGVVKHLLKAGHEVTYITPFAEKDTNPNLTQIDVKNKKEFLKEMDSALSIKNLMENDISKDIDFMFTKLLEVHIKTFKDENIQKLVLDPKVKFDLVITEWLFSEIGAIYAAVFDTPYIWVSTTEQHGMILRLIDETLNPAYSIGIISSNVTPLTFLQRLEELFSNLYISYYLYMYADVQQKQAYDSLVVPIITNMGRKAPTFDELRYNASMVLGNAHVSLGEAIRLPQNYKPIAGYHIEETVKPLPDDLKKIMDNAPDGVIYFSMGSNLKSKDWPEEIKSGLLKVFGGLKQTVIWKFEEDFPNLPKNVHVLKWAPQPSILSHPNCILFITHGGLLSTTETIHFGVPVIGIPVFADQFANVNRAVNKGFAKKVDLTYNLVNDLEVAIKDIVNDPKYRNKAIELSLIYHDRPVRPGVELVHWAEHVIQTRGAPHLRSPALMVPWYQKIYLDLTVLVFVTLFILLKISKFLYTVTFSKKTNMSKKRN